jgi:hypothetical protein
MRRSGTNRWIGLVLGALWCAAFAARPTLLACPMGAHHAAPSHSTGADPDPIVADHDAHALHVASGPADVSSNAAIPDAPDAPAHDTPCDCLGHCCATSVIAPGAWSSTLAASYRDPAPVPGLPQHEFVAHWVDFVLPFATAPPSMVTG